MVSLLLRELAHTIYKCQGLFEVRELELPNQVVLADDLPLRNLLVKRSELLTPERRHSPTARYTGFSSQGRHGGLLSRIKMNFWRRRMQVPCLARTLCPRKHPASPD